LPDDLGASDEGSRIPNFPGDSSSGESTLRMDKLSPSTSGSEMRLFFGQGFKRDGSPGRAQNAQADEAICQTGQVARIERIFAEADDWEDRGRVLKIARISSRSRCFSGRIIENLVRWLPD